MIVNDWFLKMPDGSEQKVQSFYAYQMFGKFSKYKDGDIRRIGDQVYVFRTVLLPDIFTECANPYPKKNYKLEV